MDRSLVLPRVRFLYRSCLLSCCLITITPATTEDTACIIVMLHQMQQRRAAAIVSPLVVSDPARENVHVDIGGHGSSRHLLGARASVREQRLALVRPVRMKTKKRAAAVARKKIVLT